MQLVLKKSLKLNRFFRDKAAIYSPGVGAQGGGAEAAIRAGADYLIVGREITMATDPAEAAQKLLYSIKGI